MLSENDFKCKNCRKLLFKGWLEQGCIAIKCTKCKHINYIRNYTNYIKDKDTMVDIPKIPEDWLGIEFIIDK